MTDKNEEDFETNFADETQTMDRDQISKHNFSSDILVGQMLDDRFQIEKNLTDSGADAGGIGLVYLAKDTKLMGKRVVVKILQKAATKSEDIVRKFQHEKEALIRLEHPNIVRILDDGTLSDGNPFMVMEFIEGYSLRRKIGDGIQLSFDEAAYFIETVTEALDAAHTKQILHRDIKPENIMLTPKKDGFDHVRLIDFGIARVENSKLAAATQVARGIGTIRYIAPEQLFGKLEQTAAVDIYSFSVVVYEMLTGQLPFNPQSPVEMFQMQKEGVKIRPSELRPEISPDLERLLLLGLEFEAQKRPQKAMPFGKALSAALKQSINRGQNGEFLDIPDTIPSGYVSKPIPPSETTNSSDFSESSFRSGEPSIERKQLVSRKTWIWGALVGLILAAISLPVGFVLWNSGLEGFGSNSSEVNSKKSSKSGGQTSDSKSDSSGNNGEESADKGPDRELTYFLEVQKMRDGKPFEDPFKSSGMEVFEKGYKFKMNFEVNSDGFIYIFNEDTDIEGNKIYNILYPTPSTNDGNADVKAKQLIETTYNTFSGQRGTESVWMIWTSNKQDDVENARNEAFEESGTIKSKETVKRLSDFIQSNTSEKIKMKKDSENRQTMVQGSGAVFVHRIELEYR